MASESTRKTASLEADAARTQERRPHGASAARPLRGTTVRTRNRPEKTSFLPEHGPENNDGKKTRTPCPAPLSPAQAGKHDADGGKGVFRSVVPKPRRRRKRAFSPQKGADEVRLPPFSIRRQAQRFQRRGFFASDTPRCLRSFLLRRTRHAKPERPESEPCAGTAGTRRGASSRTRRIGAERPKPPVAGRSRKPCAGNRTKGTEHRPGTGRRAGCRKSDAGPA